MTNKFKKDDSVIVISGSSKGKKGKILDILGDFAIVEGVNLATIHKKPTSNSAGEIIKSPKKIHKSNISHIEGGSPVKIKFVTEDGEGKKFKRKVRVSRKTSKKID
ncbi:MAG: large subunit ribosomal protein L24 [Rickettsiales bacterium]|jgi:large subunit ribosomal protein L24